jgi:hypothetical protein
MCAKGDDKHRLTLLVQVKECLRDIIPINISNLEVNTGFLD